MGWTGWEALKFTGWILIFVLVLLDFDRLSFGFTCTLLCLITP
jgi:hypothetical protein